MNALICGGCFDKLKIDREAAVTGWVADTARAAAKSHRGRCHVCGLSFRTLPDGATINADLVNERLLIEAMAKELRLHWSALR